MTIPKRIVEEIGLRQGDLFEVVIVEGEIRLVPVVVWPKARVEELEREGALARREREAGTSMVYDDVDSLVADLHKAVEWTSSSSSRIPSWDTMSACKNASVRLS